MSKPKTSATERHAAARLKVDENAKRMTKAQLVKLVNLLSAQAFYPHDVLNLAEKVRLDDARAEHKEACERYFSLPVDAEAVSKFNACTDPAERLQWLNRMEKNHEAVRVARAAMLKAERALDRLYNFDEKMAELVIPDP